MPKKQKIQRIAYAHFGDTHSGLENGLIAPGSDIRRSSDKARLITWEGMSNWSQWIWESVWLPSIERANEFAGSDPLILCIDGDMVHGSRFQEALYTPFIDQQVDIFVRALDEWRKCPTLAGIAMVYGTGAHDYGNDAASKKIYDKVAPWGYSVVVDDHINLIPDGGMHIDLSHHGPVAGMMPHTKGNIARAYAKARGEEFLKRGLTVPALFQRGHVHMDVYETVQITWLAQYIETAIIVTPPLCGPNGYARQASRSTDRIRCGMFLSESIDGKIGEVVPLIYERESRRYYQMDFGTRKRKENTT
jgi:hypothetical protein